MAASARRSVESDTVKSQLMAKSLVSNLHQLIKAEQADEIKMKQADQKAILFPNLSDELLIPMAIHFPRFAL